MSMQTVADALARLEKVLRRRPQLGLTEDSPAHARWSGPQTPLRIVCRHPSGREVCTDLPPEAGGGGDEVTPGWLYRAGLANCAATSIAMLAAADGIALTTLEVEAASRSDARGLIALEDERGLAVSAAPVDQRLRVSIAARDASPAQLRALVDRALKRSPIPSAVRENGLVVQVDIA